MANAVNSQSVTYNLLKKCKYYHHISSTINKVNEEHTDHSLTVNALNTTVKHKKLGMTTNRDDHFTHNEHHFGKQMMHYSMHSYISAQ